MNTIETSIDLAREIFNNRNKEDRYLGYWVDEDLEAEEQIEQVEENLVEIIREWADDSCTCEYDDFPSYYSIHLKNGAVSVEVSCNNEVFVIGDDEDAADAMKSTAYQWSDYTEAEVYAFYGYRAPEEMLSPAGEDDTNVRIWVKRYYYEGHLGGDIDGWLCDDWHNPEFFETYADAEKRIEELESRIGLDYGEYTSPDYTICQ